MNDGPNPLMWDAQLLGYRFNRNLAVFQDNLVNLINNLRGGRPGRGASQLVKSPRLNRVTLFLTVACDGACCPMFLSFMRKGIRIKLSSVKLFTQFRWRTLEINCLWCECICTFLLEDFNSKLYVMWNFLCSYALENYQHAICDIKLNA